MTSYHDEPQLTDAADAAGTAPEWRDPDRVVLSQDDKPENDALDRAEVDADVDPVAAELPLEDSPMAGWTVEIGPLPAGNGMSDEWHDIQAMFVDDPQASVQRAAQAAEAAVMALVESLRKSQASLAPAGTSNHPADTEQLRAALRSYRTFSQHLAELELSMAGAS